MKHRKLWTVLGLFGMTATFLGCSPLFVACGKATVPKAPTVITPQDSLANAIARALPTIDLAKITLQNGQPTPLVFQPASSATFGKNNQPIPGQVVNRQILLTIVHNVIHQISQNKNLGLGLELENNLANVNTSVLLNFDQARYDARTHSMQIQVEWVGAVNASSFTKASTTGTGVSTGYLTITGFTQLQVGGTSS